MSIQVFPCDGDRDIEKGKSVIRNSPSKYEGQVGVSKVDKVISEAGFDWQASGEVTNIVKRRQRMIDKWRRPVKYWKGMWRRGMKNKKEIRKAGKRDGCMKEGKGAV